MCNQWNYINTNLYDYVESMEYLCGLVNNYIWFNSIKLTFENFIVPNPAVVSLVTTIQGSGNWQFINQVSLNGGTMVFISGQGKKLTVNLFEWNFSIFFEGFATNKFSTTPTSTTSNQVILTGDFASYACTIHPDKVTSNQITCYNP